MKTIVENRKARHLYTVLDTFEAGIALRGTEIKALRNHAVSIDRSFGKVERGEIWLYDMYIAPYEYGNLYNHDPRRPRKLLLHKRETVRLGSGADQKGLTIVPLRVYINERGKAKVEIALVKPKKLYDRRREIKEREEERELRRVTKWQI
jgi:SsrA-binding protein